MQILTHPIWWSNDNKTRKEIMQSFLNHGQYDNYSKIVKEATKLHEDHVKKIATEK